jgi:hypothetical protein
VEQQISKEIDFLPEWYKAGRKRKVSYKRQYTAITSLFAILVAWSFVVDHSASVASAKIDRRDAYITINQKLTAEYNQIKGELLAIKAKADLLDSLSPKVDFANVIAELSFVINENIMLSTLDVAVEPIENKPENSQPVVNIGGKDDSSDQAMPYENRRFKVSLAGIAAGAPDVAMLISQLEASPYFCNIIPGFSKTKEINENLVTEFQITCYVANYKIRK